MTTLGAVFRPQYPPERLREVVRAAEESGLEELWLWEDCFLESGLATAAAALAWSERLRVGVGLTPVPLRNVALTAMETATLDRLFPGRFQLGVGHGVQDWMGQVGARAESPLTLLREYLDGLRALLAGERVSREGRYVRLDGVQLDWPPATPTRIYAGGTGPRTLKLTGEAADGTILDADLTVERVGRAVELINEARAAAGRTGPHHFTVYVHAATGPDATERLHRELAAWGHDPTADMGIAGDAAEVAKGIERLVAAGADTVVLQPTADEPDPAGFMRFVAEDVRPLVA
ncbi:LLM class flavin-dependent oxidoreductase [Streptomyces sp. A7024]|uniref:LLM class flavin-dependent oxidoreductase n=1 Tax=Streptomyces coryli TaxID=1128680 RepID=A0A6G4TU86_9ACTN|nr:LLM class flavin-dependent oxidoreductase [Streptomyces coryli]NGN63545.1 LLM class flavin-dependent oxidoreductase [Streptomyces coryli]